MSKIENHSIFGHYSQEENRVTAALLQIFKVGGTNFIADVISQIDDIDFPSSEINIITQEREKENVYDGVLSCNFSFRVLVESKIKQGAINSKQLEGLIQNAENDTDYILYVTPDFEKPEELNQSDKIYWTNWKKISQILSELNTNTEPLNFLINEFGKYLENLGLLDIISYKNRVQIVAGSCGEPRALDKNVYICQNERTFRPSKYLAFYNRGGIHSLFEIIGEPQNNCDLSKMPVLSDYLKKYEPNYKGDKRQVYQLKLINDKLNIPCVRTNEKGHKVPYTMGVFRYTTIDKLKAAKTTDDL